MNFFLVPSVCQSVTSVINKFLYNSKRKVQKKRIAGTHFFNLPKTNTRIIGIFYCNFGFSSSKYTNVFF